MKKYNVYNANGDFVSEVELDEDTWQNNYLTIDDCEPVWDAMPEGTFPNQSNDWFHFEGDKDSGEYDIYGFDGKLYASLVEIPATIDYHSLAGQESGIVIEGNVLAICNWAYDGGIQVEGIVRKFGTVDDVKSMLDYIQRDDEIVWQYSDVLDDNNDLPGIISEVTPGKWWEIEDSDGDTIIVIAPDGWN